MNNEWLREDVRRWGWARSIFIRVIKRLNKHLGIYVTSVRTRPLRTNPPNPNSPSGLSLRILDRATILAASEDRELDMSRAWVESALAYGGVAFGAFDGNTLVAYDWRTLDVAPHVDGFWIKVNRPYRYGYKAFVRREYRGKRIIFSLTCFSDAYFLKRGYTHAIHTIDVSNIPSLHASKYRGDKLIGFAGYVRWFGRYITFRTPAVIRTGFTFFYSEATGSLSSQLS